MSTARWSLAVTAALLLGPVGFAQDPKKDEPKKEDAVKEKGYLPTYWKMLGLSSDQVQKVYKIQNKYAADIDILEGKIKQLKDQMAKERGEVLTADQKKRLEEIIKDKAGTGKDK